MKRTSRFVCTDDETSLPSHVSLGADEALVGWYPNPAPWEGNVVVFTTTGLHFSHEGRPVMVQFDDIVDFETPADKGAATGVRVWTSGGDHFIPMSGRYGPSGKFGDVFSLIMILQVLTSRQPSKRDTR